METRNDIARLRPDGLCDGEVGPVLLGVWRTNDFFEELLISASGSGRQLLVACVVVAGLLFGSVVPASAGSERTVVAKERIGRHFNASISAGGEENPIPEGTRRIMLTVRSNKVDGVGNLSLQVRCLSDGAWESTHKSRIAVEFPLKTAVKVPAGVATDDCYDERCYVQRESSECRW